MKVNIHHRPRHHPVNGDNKRFKASSISIKSHTLKFNNPSKELKRRTVHEEVPALTESFYHFPVRVFVKGLRILEREQLELSAAVAMTTGCNAEYIELPAPPTMEHGIEKVAMKMFCSGYTGTRVSVIFMGKLILIRLLLFHTAALWVGRSGKVTFCWAVLPCLVSHPPPR